MRGNGPRNGELQFRSKLGRERRNNQPERHVHCTGGNGKHYCDRDQRTGCNEVRTGDDRRAASDSAKQARGSGDGGESELCNRCWKYERLAKSESFDQPGSIAD